MTSAPATSPEAAATARVLALCGNDAALRHAVRTIYAAPVPRMTAPSIEIAGIAGAEWGTKDRAGAELVVSLRHAAPAGDDGGSVAARLRALVPALRGSEGGWDIVSARLIRTRRTHDAQGRVEQGFEVRLRLLAAG